jgi:hypothetical protein
VHLGVAAHTVTPRLRYAAGLYARLLGVPISCYAEPDFVSRSLTEPSPTHWIGYGVQVEGVAAYIEPDGLLFESGINRLRKAPAPADPFAYAFWHTAEYSHYQLAKLDAHSRYREPAPGSGYAPPSVFVLARQLAERLGIDLPRPQPRISFTLDLDFPWVYAHKGSAVQLGAVFKRLALMQLRGAADALRVLAGGPDPSDVYAQLPHWLPPARTRIFVLAGGRTPFDSRYGFSNPHFVKLLNHLHTEGYAFGIHPSYAAAWDPEVFARELAVMANWHGPVEHCRFHYGRYRLPHSRRMLLAHGVRNDYTTFFVTQNGFRHNFPAPFPWYDLEAEVETELMLHPTIWMDRVFLSALRLTPEKAIQQAQALNALAAECGGDVCVLVHNELFSNYGEWKGWLPFAKFVSTC